MNISDKILNIEKKHNLNSFNVNGFRPWTYIRHIIELKASYKLASTKSLIFKIIRNLPFMLSRKSKLNVKKIDVLFSTSPRRTFIKGLYECIYTDEIADAFPNSVTLEQSSFEILTHYTPAKTKNLIYSDRIFVKSCFYLFYEKYVRKSRYFNAYTQIDSYMRKPLSELFDSTDIGVWTEKMTDRYFIYLSMYKSYEQLLQRLSPKLVIEVSYYHFDHMVINELSKKMNIPTIELQHGVIIKNSVFNTYYCESTSHIPDMVLLFSNYYKDMIRYSIKSHNMIPVGFPYFDKQLQKHKTNNNTTIGDKVLIFLSSMTDDGFDKIALDVFTRISKSGWKVIFKLHPWEYNDWASRYPILINSDIDVIGNNKKNIYEIFSICHAVVGINSTAIFEAIGFGLPTFIIDLPGASYVEDLWKNDYAVKVSDCDELCYYIENLDDYDCAKDIEDLWMPNSLENIKNVIFNLLHDKMVECKHDKS